ncbi:hypothetical protein SDJN03_14615, partial [Cucurbita argyrosperma subsp. sororia]
MYLTLKVLLMRKGGRTNLICIATQPLNIRNRPNLLVSQIIVMGSQLTRFTKVDHHQTAHLKVLKPAVSIYQRFIVSGCLFQMILDICSQLLNTVAILSASALRSIEEGILAKSVVRQGR